MKNILLILNNNIYRCKILIIRITKTEIEKKQLAEEIEACINGDNYRGNTYQKAKREDFW